MVTFSKTFSELSESINTISKAITQVADVVSEESNNIEAIAGSNDNIATEVSEIQSIILQSLENVCIVKETQ
ncbi:hypothetical protein [Wukongibacter sp. M2B1]|uniref:hypothetical protein n=1 Tax=Wukongibacter sp. M2B1 TaxID=3088895 RepID=UPI003D7BB875